MCTFSVLGVFVRIRIGSHVVTITGSGNQPGSAGMRGITRRASRVVVPPGPNLVHVDASTLQHMSDFKHKTSVSSSNSKKSVISTGVSRPAWRVGRVRGFIYHSISFDKFDISDFLRFLGWRAAPQSAVGDLGRWACRAIDSPRGTSRDPPGGNRSGNRSNAALPAYAV